MIKRAAPMLFLLVCLALPGQSSASADESYSLPDEYLGEWKNYSDDVPHSYELRKDGMIVCRPARPETCGDFSPTAYKYIFNDEKNAYVLARRGHLKTNRILYFSLDPAKDTYPSLLRWNDTRCSYPDKMWNDFDAKKLEKDIKSYQKSDAQLWSSSDPGCLEKGGSSAYQRP